MNVDEQMQNVITRLNEELQTIRTGRANPALVSDLPVDSYGTMVPLKQIAQISTPDAQSLIISPWDASLVANIAQAIRTSDIGMEPNVDATTIRLALPPMTEERRQELTKVVGEKLEASRVQLRNIRHEAISQVEKEDLPQDAMKHRKEELTKKVQEYTAKAEELAEQKKLGLLTI